MFISWLRLSAWSVIWSAASRGESSQRVTSSASTNSQHHSSEQQQSRILHEVFSLWLSVHFLLFLLSAGADAGCDISVVLVVHLPLQIQVGGNLSTLWLWKEKTWHAALPLCGCFDQDWSGQVARLKHQRSSVFANKLEIYTIHNCDLADLSNNRDVAKHDEKHDRTWRSHGHSPEAGAGSAISRGSEAKVVRTGPRGL